MCCCSVALVLANSDTMQRPTDTVVTKFKKFLLKSYEGGGAIYVSIASTYRMLDLRTHDQHDLVRGAFHSQKISYTLGKKPFVFKKNPPKIRKNPFVMKESRTLIWSKTPHQRNESPTNNRF